MDNYYNYQFGCNHEFPMLFVVFLQLYLLRNHSMFSICCSSCNSIHFDFDPQRVYVQETEGDQKLCGFENEQRWNFSKVYNYHDYEGKSQKVHFSSKVDFVNNWNFCVQSNDYVDSNPTVWVDALGFTWRFHRIEKHMCNFQNCWTFDLHCQLLIHLFRLPILEVENQIDNTNHYKTYFNSKTIICNFSFFLTFKTRNKSIYNF